MAGMIEVHPRGEAPGRDRRRRELGLGERRGMRHRNFDPPAHIAAAGMDSRGRMFEMVGVELEDGAMLVYHAMKLTPKMAMELGLG